MERTPIITLTTDFGTADGYVGTMKGVILSIAPDAHLVDLSHEIAPQNVREAAYVLYASYAFFPSRTVHLVVVDPGVGGARRPIALRTPAGTFVGPDNGVFSYVTACEPVEALVALADSRYHLPRVGYTFHGRDIFAPAAAHLAAGISINDLGPPVVDSVVFPPPCLDVASDGIVGEVLHIDRFGNVVTSIGRLLWSGDELSLEPALGDVEAQVRFAAARATVAIAGREIVEVRHTYAEAEPGALLALVSSSGHLEVAVHEGSAAERLEVHPGDTVVVRF
jgi:S-adenosylmethionine hydrolase